jgi:hypothetical protein
VNLRAGLVAVAKREYPCLCQESNPDRPAYSVYEKNFLKGGFHEILSLGPVLIVFDPSKTSNLISSALYRVVVTIRTRIICFNVQ